VEGVLSLPDSAVLRAGQGGFVQARLAVPGQDLASGGGVLQLQGPELQAELAGQQARVQAAQVRLDAARSTDPAAAERHTTELRAQQTALDDLQQRLARLQVVAQAPGRLWQARAEDMDQRWVGQGEVVAYVLPDEAPRLRVVVDQADATLIRHHTREVSVRTPFEPGRSWPATVLRSVPAASDQLPSAALGRSGGGGVATDPRDDSGRRALATHFELELALPADYPHRLVGARASVRFEHAPEPLAPRVARALRRLFLAHFQT
jgi:putative peptide zinc metalloprotease protein